MTNAGQAAAKHVLLICSVGGSPEPIAAAIRHWRPARIMFLCSDQTCASINAALENAAAEGGPATLRECTDKTLLSDPQDLQRTLCDLRSLDRDVRSWRQRGDDYAVVVDFTGGTKVMSAALALVARRWKCTFAYVGGQERNKNGVGVVVSGREQPISHFNPWDALGYQAIEQAVTVFNHGGYAAAAALMDAALKNADDPAVKRELATLKAVIDAYAAWDRFDHQTAATEFDHALKSRNDLAAIFPQAGSSLIVRLKRHRDRVKQLKNEPTAAWVEDLLHNARRRAAECRFDDAVARLYRAFEALAQVQLRDKHHIADTKAVPPDRLPEALRAEWAGRARNGSLMLGLQDAWRVLQEFGDELGRRFVELGLADTQKSPFVARNQSILAHGFEPVSEDAYKRLNEKLCDLASLSDGDSLDWPLPVPDDSSSRPGPTPGAATGRGL